MWRRRWLSTPHVLLLLASSPYQLLLLLLLLRVVVVLAAVVPRAIVNVEFLLQIQRFVHLHLSIREHLAALAEERPFRLRLGADVLGALLRNRPLLRILVLLLRRLV